MRARVGQWHGTNGAQDRGKTFIIPKIHEAKDELPQELNEMLDSVLRLGADSEGAGHRAGAKLKRKKRLFNVQAAQSVELEYVYDVYYRDKAVQESWDRDKIGYIRFEESDVLVNEDEEDSVHGVSDDEDSNAEDFYRNDYPEDEDAERESSESEEDPEEDPEGEEDEQRSEHLVLPQQQDFDEFDGLYDEFYGDSDDDEAAGPDLLARISSQEYPRHQFFPTDLDDPLAQHRDRIFHQLEQMLQE